MLNCNNWFKLIRNRIKLIRYLPIEPPRTTFDMGEDGKLLKVI